MHVAQIQIPPEWFACEFSQNSGTYWIYRVSQKNLYTFEMAAEWKVYDSGGKGLGVWIAYYLNFHMTP